ncbi:MAG: MFS transporter [Deltaproteobacteria bacterium]|nr:MFS transporter [Deltaproteobacteria bacterium]
MQGERLPLGVKLVYGLGDHSVNVALVALTMILPFYLTEVVGMKIGLAGLVPLVGRSVDALTDVWMGRLSDRTTWRAGRRRPYLLIGALPFSLTFAAIWAGPPIEREILQFTYYATVYALFSVSMTVVAVPYQALLPELTDDYHERTSLATFRSVSSILGTFVTLVCFKPLADALGGDATAWATSGAVLAIWILLPWIPIYRVTYERSRGPGTPELDLREYLRLLVENRTFRRLLGLFTLGRMAIDLPLALFLHYFTYVIGRPGDFTIMMASFLASVVVSMPFWLRLARGRDKATIYRFGCVGWIFGLGCLFLNQPDWPRSLTFVFTCLAGIGYSAADMIPWSMVADVADEDEIQSGERREGLYVGVFTFVRKFAGAVGVALALNVLGWVGFRQGEENDAGVLWTLRALTALVPILFVVASARVARGYPITRARHAEILSRLGQRPVEPRPS